MNDVVATSRPVAVVTASELARDGGRVRHLATFGWVLVTRRGKPTGAVVGLGEVTEVVDWTDPGRFVSARDLNRTGAVSDVLDAVEAGEVRVLTEHNRPIAALVPADAFVERLKQAVRATRGEPRSGGGVSFGFDLGPGPGIDAPIWVRPDEPGVAGPGMPADG